MTKPRTIHVSGRRWFERVNGNTYHTARVWVDGKEVEAVPFQYGYGDQYLQSAYEGLMESGTLPKLTYPNGIRYGLRRTCEEFGIALSYDVADVARKGDLHNHGKDRATV